MPRLQTWVLRCPVFMLLLGGARGGAKTFACLLDAVRHIEKLGSAARVLVVRAQERDLEDTIEDWAALLTQLGFSKPAGRSNLMRAPNGGTIRFGYLKTEKDVSRYAGWNLTHVVVEEVNQIAEQRWVYRLAASVRSARTDRRRGGGRAGERRFLMTANPNGPGHPWLRKEFVLPHRPGKRVLWIPVGETLDGTPRWVSAMYIPSLVTDNVELLKADPGYIDRILLATKDDEKLRRAWLFGDWDAFEGAFFDNFDEWAGAGGVVRDFRVPRHWPRFLSADWGSARPFCVHWWAVAPGDYRTSRGTLIPRGACVLHREHYGAAVNAQGQSLPNTGRKISAYQLGEEIAELSADDPPRDYAVIDPAAFQESGGPSVAENLTRGEQEWTERHAAHREPPSAWSRADNARLPDAGTLGGWDEVRRRMNGREVGGVRRPMMFVFESCEHLLRTMPYMVHDDARPEDMLKKGAEDHAVDSVRYGMMSRPQEDFERPKPLRGLYGGATVGDLKRMWEEAGMPLGYRRW